MVERCFFISSAEIYGDDLADLPAREKRVNKTGSRINFNKLLNIYNRSLVPSVLSWTLFELTKTDGKLVEHFFVLCVDECNPNAGIRISTTQEPQRNHHFFRLQGVCLRFLFACVACNELLRTWSLPLHLELVFEIMLVTAEKTSTTVPDI